jgi:hypothetical protein
MPSVKEFGPLDISSHAIAGRTLHDQTGRHDCVFAKTEDGDPRQLRILSSSRELEGKPCADRGAK